MVEDLRDDEPADADARHVAGCGPAQIVRAGVARAERLAMSAHRMVDGLATYWRIGLWRGEQPIRLATGRNFIEHGAGKRRQRHAMGHPVLCLLGRDRPDAFAEVEFAPLGTDDLALALRGDELKLQRQSD